MVKIEFLPEEETPEKNILVVRGRTVGFVILGALLTASALVSSRWVVVLFETGLLKQGHQSIFDFLSVFSFIHLSAIGSMIFAAEFIGIFSRLIFDNPQIQIKRQNQ